MEDYSANYCFSDILGQHYRKDKSHIISAVVINRSICTPLCARGTCIGGDIENVAVGKIGYRTVINSADKLMICVVDTPVIRAYDRNDINICKGAFK